VRGAAPKFNVPAAVVLGLPYVRIQQLRAPWLLPVQVWLLLCAANEYLRVRNVQPDILHCHDWQSATVSWGERPNNAKVAFTIHNLNYGADLVGRAMATCEVATTVSPTYAREVC
jgi:glycogen synthase